MLPVELTLDDRAGESHAYIIIPAAPSESMDIAAEILATVARPGARLLKLAADAGDADREVKEIIGTIDFSALGADIEASLQSIAQNPGIIQRLFHNVHRDTEDLGEVASFDAAYAGNWVEMYAAIRAIVDANGFLAFLG